MPRVWINICAINTASNKLSPSFKQTCLETLAPPEVVVLVAEVQAAVVALHPLIHPAPPAAPGTSAPSPTSWDPTAMGALKAPPTLVIRCS